MHCLTLLLGVLHPHLAKKSAQQQCIPPDIGVISSHCDHVMFAIAIEAYYDSYDNPQECLYLWP